MDQPRLFPNVEDTGKLSTIWCSEICDELGKTVGFLQAGDRVLNRTQRRLLERFSLMAVEFTHDLLLAEGNEQEIERRLAASGQNMRMMFAGLELDTQSATSVQSVGDAESLRLYDEVVSDLREIQSSAIDGLKNGVRQVIQQTIEEHTTPESLDSKALKELAASVDTLLADVENAFRARLSILASLKAQFAVKFGAASNNVTRVCSEVSGSGDSHE